MSFIIKVESFTATWPDYIYSNEIINYDVLYEFMPHIIMLEPCKNIWDAEHRSVPGTFEHKSSTHSSPLVSYEPATWPSCFATSNLAGMHMPGLLGGVDCFAATRMVA